VTYHRAQVVTAVSSGVANQLINDLGLPASKVEVVYNPMVEDDLAERAAEAVDHPWFASGEPPIVLACARLVEQKDYPALLEAFAIVREKTPARLFVLGDGPMRKELDDHVKRAGLTDHVCFFGFDKNPLKYMARAHLLMHASRAEGLPGSLIQTMACGTPVVSTDCDFGPREVIAEPGVDGFLVPVGDVRALAAGALRLLADPQLRRSVGARARASAGRFTVAASMARYETALEA
jgi:glycosyltransferase involved in cell wall biosynthesis